MRELIYIETYGCTANQNNGEIIQGLLERQGFIFVSKPELADVIILNTCIVKGPTRQKMIFRIKELARFSHLIVTGCMPNVENVRIRRIAKQVNPQIKIALVGTKNIHEIVKAIKNLTENKEIDIISDKKEIKLCVPKTPKKKNVGITQISEGCLGNCSYCIVRFAKGKLFSYPQDKILKNIKQDLLTCNEIWITSQDNAAYGTDAVKPKLPELMKKILAIRKNFKIRIGMMKPSSILPIIDEMIEIYKNEKMIKFLHIPVQSGSDKVLKLMNRKYDIKDFLTITERFRQQVPGLILSTDVIVGFPEETQEDFQETLNLIKKIKPEVLNISKFWAMPGTLAEKMKQVPMKESKKRATELIKLHKKIKKR